MKILYRMADVPDNERLRYILSEFFDLPIDIQIITQRVYESSIQPTSDQRRFNQEIQNWNTELRNHLNDARQKYEAICKTEQPDPDELRMAAGDMAFHAKAVCDELLFGHDRIVIQKGDDATYVGTWLDNGLRQDICKNPGLYAIMYADIIPYIIPISSNIPHQDKYHQILMEYKFMGMTPWGRKAKLDEILSEVLNKPVKTFLTRQINVYADKDPFRQTVKLWNADLIAQHMTAIHNLRVYKSEHPDYQPSDIVELEQAVSRAATALTGPIKDYHSKIAIVYDEIEKQFCVMPSLGPSVKADIEAHPEHYVIVNAIIDNK